MNIPHPQLMTKIAAMPVRAQQPRNSRIVTARLHTGNQGQYLTVPSTIYIARANHLQSEPPWQRKNILCIKLCACIVLVFLFCVLTVFIYSILLAKFSDSENRINSDTLLAALVKPKDAEVFF
uniref:Col_cuticle_N domain-containing protein n=1 Tax=Caenorhabditis tropicalis TaxID=1561998 RepID=A0A1I7TCQ9_9PELO